MPNMFFLQALIKIVKMQQEEAERERQKEDEERRQRTEQNKRVKRMLEAAFDGDVDEMKQVLKEVLLAQNQPETYNYMR